MKKRTWRGMTKTNYRNMTTVLYFGIRERKRFSARFLVRSSGKNEIWKAIIMLTYIT